MKEKNKRKTIDRVGRRYKNVKEQKELEELDDKWVEDELREFRVPEQEKD